MLEGAAHGRSQSLPVVARRATNEAASTPRPALPCDPHCPATLPCLPPSLWPDANLQGAQRNPAAPSVGGARGGQLCGGAAPPARAALPRRQPPRHGAGSGRRQWVLRGSSVPACCRQAAATCAGGMPSQRPNCACPAQIWHEVERALTTDDGRPLDKKAAAAGATYPFSEVGLLRCVCGGRQSARCWRFVAQPRASHTLRMRCRSTPCIPSLVCPARQAAPVLGGGRAGRAAPPAASRRGRPDPETQGSGPRRAARLAHRCGGRRSGCEHLRVPRVHAAAARHCGAELMWDPPPLQAWSPACAARRWASRWRMMCTVPTSAPRTRPCSTARCAPTLACCASCTVSGGGLSWLRV